MHIIFNLDVLQQAEPGTSLHDILKLMLESNI